MSKDVLLILKAGHCLSQDSASVPGIVDLTLISPSGRTLEIKKPLKCSLFYLEKVGKGNRRNWENILVDGCFLPSACRRAVTQPSQTKPGGGSPEGLVRASRAPHAPHGPAAQP